MKALLLGIIIITESKAFQFPQWCLKKVYQKLFFNLIHQYVLQGQGAKASIFLRRGLIKRNHRFSFLFSDIDIGARCADEIVAFELKRRFYRIKMFFPFLGEIEIYLKPQESAYQKYLDQYGPMYEVLRSYRKINWLRNKMIAPRLKKRTYYHRYKDYRALSILKKDLALDSTHNVFGRRASALISELLALNSMPQLLEFPQKSIYCPYLSQNIDLNQISVTLLAAVPPMLRFDTKVDEKIAEVRQQNSDIQLVYNSLSVIEYMTAAAFIRGAAHDEEWFQPWLKNLSGAVKIT